MYAASDLTNRDGTGFYSQASGKLWKTRLAPDSIVGIGETLDSVVTGKSVMGHVRAASKGIEVNDANAHPFEGKRFVLAHNGRLYKKGEKVSYSSVQTATDSSESSDSLTFLNALEEYAAANEGVPFVEMLENVMKEFKGKFAFLIYDKLTKTQYAARGKTAELSYSSIYAGILPANLEGFDWSTRIGYAIMTQSKSLSEAMGRIVLLEDSMRSNLLWYTKPMLLQENSIYELKDNEVIRVGTVTENAVAYEPAYQAASHGHWAGSDASQQPTTKSGSEALGAGTDLAIISDWMTKYFMSIVQFDALLFQVFGTGVADLDTSKLRFITEELLPALTPSQSCRKLVANTGITVFPYSEIYSDIPDFQFPWTLNKKHVIARASQIIKRKRAY